MRKINSIDHQRKFNVGSLVAIFVTALLIFTLGTVSSIAATTGPKAVTSKLGDACPKVGRTVKVVGGSLICAKVGTKLRWSYPRAKIRVAVASATIQANNDVAILGVAKGMKYFAQENIEVENILTAGSIAAVQAVASRQADITAADLASILAAIEKGVPLKIVGGLVSVWPWRIAVLPDSPIASPRDLKGKKIGVISLASGSYPYAKGFVEAGDLAFGEAEYIPVGLGAPAAAALTSGKVDALALYTAVYAQLESAGVALKYLKNPETFEGVRSISWTVNSDLAKEKPQLVERFLRASYKALAFSATSPEKAMYLGYEQYPVLLAGSSKAARIGPDVKALTAWLESAGISAVGTTRGWPKVWGDIPTQDWLRTQAFATSAGQIKRAITISNVWLPNFLKAANDFDRKAIITEARKYRPNKN